MNIMLIINYAKKLLMGLLSFGPFVANVAIFSVLGTVASFLFFELVHKIFGSNKPKKRDGASESKYARHARECGISHRFGESALVYNVGVRGLGAALSGCAALFFTGDALTTIICLAMPVILTSVLTKILSIRDEEECELDVYRMLCNLSVQLKSGSYVDSCIERTMKNCLSPRFEASLSQFVCDMNNKALTMAESAEYFGGSFLSPAFKDMASILVTFMTYGQSDQVYSEIDEACKEIIELNSVRLAKQVTGRGEFAVNWIYVLMFTALVPSLLAKYGDVPAISNFICRIIEGFCRIVS